MTEQEKRIVEIRRISEVLSASWCRKGKCTENECAIDECDLLTTAKVLHDAGYRKEEEVQKETASNIVNLINEVLLDYFFDDGAVFYANKLKLMIVKEFGVEVDE